MLGTSAATLTSGEAADVGAAGWLARLGATNQNGQQATADDEALRRLDALVGTWELTATFPGDPPTVFRGAQTSFEWMPGRRLLVQRTDLPDDGPPSSLTVITYDEAGGAYRQHYFDSRGVVRLYEMTLIDQEWTLLRTTADFSPLEFSQQFIGRFSEDGTTITGAWEKKGTDESWEHDFALTYSRSPTAS